MEFRPEQKTHFRMELKKIEKPPPNEHKVLNVTE
jgi:hypothetical protein